MATDIGQRRFTVDEYERMAKLGIIGPDEKVELIEGTIVTVPPSGEDHSSGITRLNHHFVVRFSGRAIVQSQLPVRVSDNSLPEPDVAILRYDEQYYGKRRPRASDVLALVEVSYSSVAFDAGAKLRAYARAGVSEYWIVNVRDNRIAVHRDPKDLGFATQREIGAGGRIAFLAFPGDTFSAEEIMPTVGEPPELETDYTAK